MNRQHPSLRSRVSLLIAALGALALGGCGNSAASFTPTETSAREALSLALKSWQEGQAANGTPLPAPVTTQFGDYEKATGKRLTAFDILTEKPAQQGSGQSFRVRLELAGEPAKEVEYHVVGLDPLWILRDHDYRQASMQ